MTTRHFKNDEVVAVGGRLLVMHQDGSLLEEIQRYEYMKVFQIVRCVFAKMNGQCLISGAFGIFRKSALIEIGGYDNDTVGEDMELVLRLQNKGEVNSELKIVYDKATVCYTSVPRSLKKLLHQKDRW